MCDSILVVDDDDNYLTFLTILLKRQGYRPRPFASASKAIESLRAEPASLVISDLFMPEMDGIEFARALRIEAPGIPMIGLSGWPTGFRDIGLRMLQELGADAVFEKPIEEAQLLAAVSSTIGNRSCAPVPLPLS